MKRELEHIGAALGRIPSGCCILTARHGERTTGMLASWVQQASFEPPMVTVCVKRGRPIQQLVDGSKRFVLNVIADDPTAMFKHFGKGFALEDNAFDGLATTATEHGPALNACIAHLACEVRERVAAGDHDVYIAEVVSADAPAGAKPYVHLRKSGLSY